MAHQTEASEAKLVEEKAANEGDAGNEENKKDNESFEEISPPPPTASHRRERRKSISSSIISAFNKCNIRSVLQNTEDLGVADGREADNEWPDLYTLCRSMNNVSMLIYQITLVLQLVKDGKLPDLEHMLDKPLRLEEGLSLIKEHRESLRKYMAEKDITETEKALHDFDSMVERLAMQKSKNGKNHECYIGWDIEHHESGLTYGIVVNSLTKKISVVFRGTTTLTDAKTDLKLALKSIANPLKNHEGQSETISLHSGFHEYLYGGSKISSQDTDTSEVQLKSKCDTILSEVAELITNFPDYSLYVTGHSLGGALASLFSFSAACCNLPQFKEPIRCISIASPKVGNEDFRKAFELLEEQNKVRYLRVVNDGDIIPMSPEPHIPITKAVLRNRAYRHVGIQLKLYNDHRKVRVSYRRLKKGAKLAAHDFIVTANKTAFALTFFTLGLYHGAKCHSCYEYTDRLELYSDILKKLDLPSLYEHRFEDPGKEIIFDWKRDKMKKAVGSFNI